MNAVGKFLGLVAGITATAYLVGGKSPNYQTSFTGAEIAPAKQVQTDIVKQLKELDQQRENVSDKNFVQNKVCGEMLDKQQKACKWLVDNHLDAMLVEARTGKPAETSIERYLAREKLSSGESKH